MSERSVTANLSKSAHPSYGFRDEMNFAEFPLASLSDRVADNQKTLEFTDTIEDSSTGKHVVRTLVITAADKFGLPTALDDELLLGLIKLSVEQEFADPKVYFSRYELIKLLGWRDESKSYKRVEDGLNRWTGVTLQYRKSWWVNDEKSWVTETFHVLNSVTVYDRERIARRRQMAKDAPEKALSSFVWNDKVFQSFKAGYIKQLDFDFYKGLTSAISKRMFRFLDKRFYQKGRWEFDLQVFACEHIGLSKNYSNSELKRKLIPAISELEVKGFLAPLPDGERFVRERCGKWRTVFVKATRKLVVLPDTESERDPLLEDLVGRGITRRSAQKLVREHTREKIREKVRLFDQLKERGGKGAIRNRPGWLYAAIVNDYSADVAAPVQVAPEPLRTGSPKTSEPSEEQRAEQQEIEAFERFWDALTPDQQRSFEESAVTSSSTFFQKQYHSGTGGRLWQTSRTRILVEHHKQSQSVSRK